MFYIRSNNDFICNSCVNRHINFKTQIIFLRIIIHFLSPCCRKQKTNNVYRNFTRSTKIVTRLCSPRVQINVENKNNQFFMKKKYCTYNLDSELFSLKYNLKVTLNIVEKLLFDYCFYLYNLMKRATTYDNVNVRIS